MREANAYLSKPFDFNELNLFIKNLLTERERLKKQFCLSLDNQHWTKDKLPLEYNLFLEQLNEHLENNFSLSNFVPANLADLLKMSERQLQRKFKHTAGITPSKFIRQWR